MISPNLATMLSFIFKCRYKFKFIKTQRSVANSFNAITVDSDQSTNDSFNLFNKSRRLW